LHHSSLPVLPESANDEWARTLEFPLSSGIAEGIVLTSARWSNPPAPKSQFTRIE
jgi:hypothetical protein